jgi:uncharacterized protein YkwD
MKRKTNRTITNTQIYLVHRRFMKLSAILFLLFVTCGSTLLPVMACGQNISQPVKALPVEILKYINEHRTGMGLPALVMNDIITRESEAHSLEMASGKVPFGHDGFDGRTERIRAKIPYVYGWAENVAFGANTAREVVDLWLHSPGHKKNIEGKYNLTGIGVAKAADGAMYFTQIFINKKN